MTARSLISKLLAEDSDTSVRNALDDLRILARTPLGASAAFKADAFSPLLGLLVGGRLELRTPACLVLANMIGRTARVDDVFINAGGLAVVLSILAQKPLDVGLTSAACGVVQNIAAKRPSAQQSVGDAGGILHLLGALESTESPSLAEAICRALAHVCQLSGNQTLFVHADGFVRILDTLVKYRHAGTVLAACGVLQNATAGRLELQAALGRAGGASALIRTLAHHAGDASIVAAVCSALSIIVLQPSTHAAAAYSGGVASLVAALAAHADDVEVGLYGCRVALALLVGSPDCASALMRDGAAESAAWAVLAHSQNPSRGATSLVAPEDVSEAACTLLAAFATLEVASGRRSSPVRIDDTTEVSRHRCVMLAGVLMAFASNPRIACAVSTIVKNHTAWVNPPATLYRALTSTLISHLADHGVVRPTCEALVQSFSVDAGLSLLSSPTVSTTLSFDFVLAPLASTLDLYHTDTSTAQTILQNLVLISHHVDALQLARSSVLSALVLVIVEHAENMRVAELAVGVLAEVLSRKQHSSRNCAAVVSSGAVPPLVSLLVLHPSVRAIAEPVSRCLLELVKGSGDETPRVHGMIAEAGGIDALLSACGAGSLSSELAAEVHQVVVAGNDCPNA